MKNSVIVEDSAVDFLNVLSAWLCDGDTPNIMDIDKFQCIRLQVLADLLGYGINEIKVMK